MGRGAEKIFIDFVVFLKSLHIFEAMKLMRLYIWSWRSLFSFAVMTANI